MRIWDNGDGTGWVLGWVDDSIPAVKTVEIGPQGELFQWEMGTRLEKQTSLHFVSECRNNQAAGLSNLKSGVTKDRHNAKCSLKYHYHLFWP